MPKPHWLLTYTEPLKVYQEARKKQAAAKRTSESWAGFATDGSFFRSSNCVAAPGGSVCLRLCLAGTCRLVAGVFRIMLLRLLYFQWFGRWIFMFLKVHVPCLSKGQLIVFKTLDQILLLSRPAQHLLTPWEPQPLSGLWFGPL